MKKYDSINGLRTIAAIGIVMMHVLANADYKLNNVILENLIGSFTQFVYLFMIISAFSMCCGYYEKIKNNKISMNDFYKKRFIKILPFFTFLIIINTIFERTLTSVYEGFMDLTLMFGFLPVNSLSAIGVAWFLGVVFVFYMIFPFFIFLLDNKKRAWFVFGVSYILNILCQNYFFTESFGLINYGARTNFLYDFVYFVLGGIIFLYKEEISKFISENKIISIIFTIVISISYFFATDKLFTLRTLLMYALWLCVAIGIENNKVLNNTFTKFVSNISMEIYLSHMVIFRIVEKLNLTHIANNDYISYLITNMAVIIGTVILAVVFNKILDFTKKVINEKRIKVEDSISK